MAGARMARGLGLGFGLDLLVVLAAGAAPGFAQSTATTTPPPAASGIPAREGNVWDHVDHQPTAAVRGAERNAGVAAPPQQSQREMDDLTRINRELQQQHGVKNPAPP